MLASSAGKPAVKFQCQGWLPYMLEPLWSKLNLRNSQGTSTHLHSKRSIQRRCYGSSGTCPRRALNGMLTCRTATYQSQ